MRYHPSMTIKSTQGNIPAMFALYSELSRRQGISPSPVRKKWMEKLEANIVKFTAPKKEG